MLFRSNTSFRYLFAIPVLGMMIVARGRSFKLKRKEVLPLIIMGLLVALSSLALFQSYNYMDVGIASTLLFVYPILCGCLLDKSVCYRSEEHTSELQSRRRISYAVFCLKKKKKKKKKKK